MAELKTQTEPTSKKIMKKRMLLLSAVLLVTLVSVSQGQETKENKLGITLDATYVSRYLWYGMHIYEDNHSAFQPSIDVDLFGTGFSVNVWGSWANSSGFENSKELDYTVAYTNTIWKDARFATDYTINYMYYDLYDNNSKLADTQELGVDFSWPNVCPYGIVPHYYVAKLWPTGSKVQKDVSGWVHVFGFSYDHTVPGFLPNNPEQTFNFTFDIVYNDGLGGASVEHDWSHATLGLSTPITVGPAVFTPAVYYQISMEDSVNTEDEIYVGLGLSYSF